MLQATRRLPTKPPLTPERVDAIIDESMKHKSALRRYMDGQFQLGDQW